MGKSPLVRLDHIEYIVKDVDAYVKFFEMLGLEVFRRTEHHHGSVEMKLPGENQVLVEIHKVENDENPGINHIAFLSDDIEEVAKRLDERGLPHKGPVFFEPTGRTLLSFRDPGGFRFQVMSKK